MKLAPWLAETWQRTVARADNGSLPHALLLAGPQALGKRAFAEQLAAFVLCLAPHGQPCGRCRSCALFASRAQRDPEETRPDGTAAQPDGHPGHPDAKFVGFVVNDKSKKMYTEIVVEQIRELSSWLSLTSQFGHGQVALIEPADAMNAAAANALLKTLEEPSPGRFVLLVTAHPARLPATIRSRCQRIDFHVPPIAVAHTWLVEQGLDAPIADAALDASDGNPGVALELARSGRIALFKSVAADMRALHARSVAAAKIAQAWAADEADVRLGVASALVRRESDALARRISGPLALTAATDLTKLAAWFDQANRARELLRGPLRAELVVVELLQGWQALAPGRMSVPV